jgi:HK97 family phage major capsid protein
MITPDTFAQAALAPVEAAHRMHLDETPTTWDAEQRNHHDNLVTIHRARVRQAEQQVPADERPSLGRTLQCIAERRPLHPIDRVAFERSAEKLDQAMDRNRLWYSWDMLATRAMSTQPGAKGGYMVGTQMLGPADALRGLSVAQALGVQIIPDLRDNVVLPVVKTDPGTAWVAEAASASNSSDGAIGQESGTPRTVMTLLPVSMQLARQGRAMDAFLENWLIRNIAAELDRKLLAGVGGAEPLGVFNVPGVNTQAGGSLAYAGLLAMKRKCIDAGAIESDLACVANGATQELLAARHEDPTLGGAWLWRGGKVVDVPAFATKLAPSASLAIGAFSRVAVMVFGPGIQVAIDPSTLFNSGGLVLRAHLYVDVICTHPGTLSIATSIT